MRVNGALAAALLAVLVAQGGDARAAELVQVHGPASNSAIASGSTSQSQVAEALSASRRKVRASVSVGRQTMVSGRASEVWAIAPPKRPGRRSTPQSLPGRASGGLAAQDRGAVAVTAGPCPCTVARIARQAGLARVRMARWGSPTGTGWRMRRRYEHDRPDALVRADCQAARALRPARPATRSPAIGVRTRPRRVAAMDTSRSTTARGRSASRSWPEARGHENGGGYKGAEFAAQCRADGHRASPDAAVYGTRQRQGRTVHWDARP